MNNNLDGDLDGDNINSGNQPYGGFPPLVLCGLCNQGPKNIKSTINKTSSSKNKKNIISLKDIVGRRLIKMGRIRI
jgi:hypothetical protein